MIFSFNRFAFVPVMFNCCKRYIWFEPYRLTDVYHRIPGQFMKERICERCMPKYLPHANHGGKDS